MTTDDARAQLRARLLKEFRREVRDKLSVVANGQRDPLRLSREIAQKQCEDFLCEQFENALGEIEAASLLVDPAGVTPSEAEQQIADLTRKGEAREEALRTLEAEYRSEATELQRQADEKSRIWHLSGGVPGDDLEVAARVRIAVAQSRRETADRIAALLFPPSPADKEQP